jgi:hypothetical protein
VGRVQSKTKDHSEIDERKETGVPVKAAQQNVADRPRFAAVAAAARRLNVEPLASQLEMPTREDMINALRKTLVPMLRQSGFTGSFRIFAGY